MGVGSQRKPPKIGALKSVHEKKLNSHPNIVEMRNLLSKIKNHEEIKSEHLPHLKGLAVELSEKGFLKEAVEIGEIALWKSEQESQHKPPYISVIKSQNIVADTAVLSGGTENIASAMKDYGNALKKVREIEMTPLTESYFILLSAKIELLKKNPGKLRDALLSEK